MWRLRRDGTPRIRLSGYASLSGDVDRASDRPIRGPRSGMRGPRTDRPDTRPPKCQIGDRRASDRPIRGPSGKWSGGPRIGSSDTRPLKWDAEGPRIGSVWTRGPRSGDGGPRIGTGPRDTQPLKWDGGPRIGSSDTRSQRWCPP